MIIIVVVAAVLLLALGAVFLHKRRQFLHKRRQAAKKADGSLMANQSVDSNAEDMRTSW